MDDKIIKEIKKWMIDADINQVKLSELTGLSSSYISLIFNGKRKIRTDIIIEIGVICNIDDEKILSISSDYIKSKINNIRV